MGGSGGGGGRSGRGGGGGGGTAGLSEYEKNAYNTVSKAAVGQGVSSKTKFEVAGKKLATDRGAKIYLGKSKDGYKLQLTLNNPYKSSGGSTDLYQKTYSKSGLKRAAKDFGYTVKNSGDSRKNFKVFKAAGHKWPGYGGP